MVGTVKAFVGFGLLASAFSPLLIALTLVVRPLPELGWNIALAALFALPALLFALVLQAAKGLAAKRITVASSTPKDIDLVTFVSSYLAPIAIALFATDLPRLIGMLVLLAILLVVYVRSGLFALNPLFAVAGYRLYQVVEQRSGITWWVLTRRRTLPAGGVADGVRIAESVIIELGSKG
jgi:hypothetical protein